MLHFVMVFMNQNMMLRNKSSNIFSEKSSVFGDTALIYHGLSVFSTFYRGLYIYYDVLILYQICRKKPQFILIKRYLIPRTNLYIKKFRVPKNVADNCMNQNIIPRHFETSVLIQLSLLSNDIDICDCLFFITDLPIAHIS